MHTMNGFMPYTFPLQPLKGGQWTVQLDPAYFTTREQEGNGGSLGPGPVDRLSGFGGAAGIDYAFNSHAALGLLGAYFSGSGNETGSNPYYQASASDKGSFEGLVAILDPFSGDGFRLPFVLAGGPLSASTTINYPAVSGGPSSGPSVTQTKAGNLGYMVGVDPQLNTGRYLRWEPFFQVTSVTEDSTCAGAECSNSPPTDSSPGASAGVNVVWRPYNLSFFYSPSFGDKSGTSVYALRWIKTFGGHRAKAAPAQVRRP